MEAKITNLSPAKSQIDPTPFQNLRECPNPRELPHGHLFSTAHTSNLWEHFKFELRCYLGEVFLRRKPPKIEAPHQLLHLGCGDRPFDQWVNGDLYQLRFWKTSYQWMFDLRKSFCCDDNYWDGVLRNMFSSTLNPTMLTK